MRGHRPGVVRNASVALPPIFPHRPSPQETSMNRYRLLFAAIVVAAVLAIAGHRDASPARENELAPKDTPPSGKADDPAAGIRKTADDYTKAYNAGDAKTAAKSWLADGEYTDPEDETLRGRDAIEKELAEHFKANPKATVEVAIGS